MASLKMQGKVDGRKQDWDLETERGKNGKGDGKVKKAQDKLFIHNVFMGKFSPCVNKSYP